MYLKRIYQFLLPIEENERSVVCKDFINKRFVGLVVSVFCQSRGKEKIYLLEEPTRTLFVIKHKTKILRGKNKTAEHFTTGHCEPHTAHKVQGKLYFSNICVCQGNCVYYICRFVNTSVRFNEHCLSSLVLRVIGKVAILFATED